ncbi:MAG: Hpt domain-containing protein, partial [Thermoguttaceae bacterium]
MNDMSLVLEFVQEAREYIDEVEPNLIELFNDSDALGAVDSEMINMIFRLFHSMKGSAGFLSFTTVVGVTHEAETLLDKIRNGKIGLTSQMVETLCRALDLFRDMLDHIAETGDDRGFEDRANGIIARLKRLVAGEPLDSDDFIAPAAEVDEPVAAETASPQTSGSGFGPYSAAEFSVDSIPATCKISLDEILALQAAAVEEEKADSELAAKNAAKATPDTKNIENQAEKTDTSKAIEDETTALQMSPEMRTGFVQEATEQIDTLEQALLQILDDNVDNAEPMKEAFRYIHSFKGNCGFMGLKDLETLSHTMETLMDALRNGEVQPGEKNIGKLLSLLDVLRDAVGNIESGGNGRIKDLAY